MNQVGQSTAQVTGATHDASMKFTELRSAVLLGEMAMRSIKGAYDDVVNPTTRLADQTRQLQNTIGGTAEDAGKLIYAADQTGVSFESLETGLKAAIRTMQSHKSQGIEPNIEGLATLADRYNAIADPIKQSQFLMQNFGRSGVDLAQLMKLSGDQIRAMGDQAQAAGVVMGRDAVDAAYKYEQSMKALDSAVTGLKISVGEKLIPPVTALAQAETQAIDTQSLINQAVKDGVITNNEAYNMQVKLSYGVLTQQQVTEQLLPAIKAHNDATNASVVATRDALEANKDYGYSLGILKDLVTSADFRIAQYAEDSKKAELADRAAALAIGDKTRALIEANDKSAVAAGIAGTLTKNEDAYYSVLAVNNPKIADLKDQIAKLTAAQGDQITVTKAGTITADQYALQQDKVALAVKAVTDYHGKNAMQLLQLKVNAEQAQQALDKMGTQMGSQTTLTEDNSKKLDALNTQLFDLQVAEETAKDAMQKANKEFLYQQVLQGLSAEQALSVSHALGIMDDKTYDAALAARGFAKDLESGKITQQQFNTDLQISADKLNGIPPAVSQIPAVLKPAIDSFKASALSAEAAATAAHDLNTAMSLLHSVNVSVSVHHTDTYDVVNVPPPPAGTGGGRQHGGRVLGGVSYLVGEAGPELFVPRSSGTIVPNSQMNGGGDNTVAQMLVQMNALMDGLPQMMARAVRDAVQLNQ